MREKRTQCYEREEDTVLRERRGHSVTHSSPSGEDPWSAEWAVVDLSEW